jgi:hypothetical protein
LASTRSRQFYLRRVTRGDSDRELREQPDFNLSIEDLSTFEFECDAAEFEELLSLDYILQADYMRRSLSWSCAYLHARIETHRRLDSATNIGAEFANAWQREGHGERVNYDSVEGVGRLESVLARDEFRPVEAEYQRLRRKKNRRPEWFQLFDGANNRRELAKAVHQETDYMALYSGWSGFSHAADASPYLRPGREPPRVGLPGSSVSAQHAASGKFCSRLDGALHADRACAFQAERKLGGVVSARCQATG